MTVTIVVDGWKSRAYVPEVNVDKNIKALEFFAGIGGFSAASKSTDIEVIGAFEISPHCVDVFANSWSAPVHQVDLLSTKVHIPDADLWWISAPCTPFTRRGAQRDLGDHRAEPFVAMTERIDHHRPSAIIMENVEGFHESAAHALWLETVADYHVWESVICPTELGVPNKRPRYYSIATQSPIEIGPFEQVTSFSIRDILTLEAGKSVASKIFEKYGRVMHLVDDASDYTTCFTGGYGKSWVYAGSYIATDHEPRLFSPQQIERVMGLPDLAWPETFSERQKYKYLGNSLSVWVVRSLLRTLQPQLQNVQPNDALNPSLVGKTDTRG